MRCLTQAISPNTAGGPGFAKDLLDPVQAKFAPASKDLTLLGESHGPL
jgi:hypothetical protein